MSNLIELENKIRQSVTFLKEEYEISKEGEINEDRLTPIMLNHVLEYMSNMKKTIKIKGTVVLTLDGIFHIAHDFDGLSFIENADWNLKSCYLSQQSDELINFLNELK